MKFDDELLNIDLEKHLNFNDYLESLLYDINKYENAKGFYFIPFLRKQKWIRENLPALINSTVMTAGFTKLIGLSKNPLFKIVGFGLIGAVNYVMLYEKYKKDFDIYIEEKKYKEARKSLVKLEAIMMSEVFNKAKNNNIELSAYSKLMENKLNRVSWDKKDVLLFWKLVEQVLKKESNE